MGVTDYDRRTEFLMLSLSFALVATVRLTPQESRWCGQPWGACIHVVRVFWAIERQVIAARDSVGLILYDVPMIEL
jgi:hypothetical protein